MASIIKSPKLAKKVLQGILDDRIIYGEKNEIQLAALDWGARALERANANGANLRHEAGIVRYQANNKTAVLLPCEDHTRGALKAAVVELEKMIKREEGGAHE